MTPAGRRSWHLLFLSLAASGCAPLPADRIGAPAPPSPARIERQRFPKPKANFEAAVRIVSEEWYDPDLGPDAIYAHAWHGLLKQLSFEDAATAAAVEKESERIADGRARFAAGVLRPPDCLGGGDGLALGGSEAPGLFGRREGP